MALLKTPTHVEINRDYTGQVSAAGSWYFEDHENEPYSPVFRIGYIKGDVDVHSTWTPFDKIASLRHPGSAMVYGQVWNVATDAPQRRIYLMTEL